MTDDDLSERVAALEDAVADLRRATRPRRRRRPPTPGEVLRTLRDFGIPAAIAALEAQVRALELLAAVLGSDPDRRERRRAASLGRTAVSRLDAALADLEGALSGDGPQNPEARRLLSEVRDLRGEVVDALDERLPEPPDGKTIPVDEESAADRGPQVDVERELDSLRSSIRGEETGGGDGEGDGRAGDDENGDGGQTGSKR